MMMTDEDDADDGSGDYADDDDDGDADGDVGDDGGGGAEDGNERLPSACASSRRPAFVGRATTIRRSY